MADIKISIIGAGGGFVVGLIHDICMTPSLHGCTVSLMDIDPERLETSHKLCRRYAKEKGVRLEFEVTQDRRESLRGADFVVTIALTDGPRRLKEGWRIALEHGYKWGGSYHILYDEPFWLNFYQLRLFESITEDILDICPGAWHLLVSNPMVAAVTLLSRKYPQCNMVGLCHGFVHADRIGERLGFSREEVTWEIPGVNHFVWMTQFHHRGSDLFPVVDEWLTREAEAQWAAGGEAALDKKRADLYRIFGAIPIGDTASAMGASWPWWYHSSDAVEKSWDLDSEKPWFDYLEHIAHTPQRLRELAEDTSKSVSDAINLGSEPTREVMVPIIESISQGTPRVVVVNVLNAEEYVPGIPTDFQVEISALVSARGVQGIGTKGLPKPILAHILRDRVAPVEMELAAYESGSRDLLIQLVLMDKWTESREHADALVNDIFALPYHKELREHYA